MNKIFAALIALGILALAAQAQPSPASETPKEEYARFLAQSSTRESIADCISVMDRLVDEGEHGLVDKQPDPGTLEGATKLGLRIDFSATDAKQAVIYYLKISRDGKDLKYSDAVKFVALFTDRAGLPHPVNVSEGDKSAFYARWLIKPSQWKSMRKMMVKARAENRAEPDPFKAFLVSIEREMEARAKASQSN